ncbi:MAG: ribonuclease III [Dechloromonas sp.]|uniref:Ribonuclease 3 n=1 Tax=Candidatus Dechloromonas phosphorivorans TaxID=2899244 RepID=A0A9D7LRR8_9RHOO|nr:ribonuclease III [Candidatus Dechloromonas phosphorivorans]
MDLSTLPAALGHAFADPALLQTALTHRSFGNPNNERLEFIGDGVLNCVIAVALFRRHPDLAEGELSRLRANLVRQDALHRLAVTLSIGKYLRLGEGELRSGGSQRPSILADALEALIGAVYLDGGFEAAQTVIARLYLPLFDELMQGQPNKDAKTRLQEWLQGRKRPLPRYLVIEASGAAHEQRFEVACEIENPAMRTIGQGSSRRLAEQAAADSALKVLKA